MSKINLSLVTLFVASFGMSAMAANFVINPLNVPERVLNYASSRVTDHRVDPPLVYYRHSPKFDVAAGTRGHLTIKYLNGNDYNFADGVVTIRNKALNLCLTNPDDYRGAGTNKLTFEPCRTQTSMTVGSMRQRFVIRRNTYGATRFETHLMGFLQVPNARPECLEQNGPNVVEKRFCNNLNNFQIRRFN